MARYEVVAISRSSGQERRIKFTGAPSEQKIANWLGRKHAPNDWMATRYYPSRKGWLVLDFAHAFIVPLRGRDIPIWKNIQRSKKAYPSEDVAVMVIRHRMAMPEQLALIL